MSATRSRSVRLPAPGPARRAALGLLTALLTAAAGLGAVSLPARASAPPPAAGWTTVFSEEFDGPAGSGVDTTHWQYTTGTSYPGGPARFGTGEIETMTADPANVSLDGAGNLRITPLRDAAGNWTSGRIETRRGDFQPPVGGKLRVEARIQMPNVTGAGAKGYWPAFWMLGTPYRGNWWNWPGIGELDIMENVQGINQVWTTMHCGTSPGGPCNETSGIGGQRACSPLSCQAGFHTYAVEWDRGAVPQEMRFSLDESVFHTVRQTQVDPATWASATEHGYFLILNVAMGGGFPDAFGGGPDAGTLPGRPMVVDYVRVLQSGPGSSTPPPTPAPSPSPPTTAPPGSRDAYGTLQAESYDGQWGVVKESTSDTGGGEHLAALANGDGTLYRAVDFGSTAARQFYGRVASGAAGGVSGLVEVRLDSRTSTPVGSFAVASTGGWQSWRTVPANITPVTGVHDVYLTFTSGQSADFVNLNWFGFGH
ncbi:glycoside hydrolase family 16 protein [Streptomyces sp. NPDC006879]|uniref:glycoside hydrolase family 16 protein n=1 Tax=Streptomyces sp. NPDC006879 TaxID=3364767 RepID=UPI0036BED43A